MKQLGDSYVKSEFRLHKSANPEQAKQFLDEWSRYLEQILTTARARDAVSVGAIDIDATSGGTSSAAGRRQQQQSSSVFAFGADLPSDVDLSEEQRAQLEKLRSEAAGKARGGGGGGAGGPG